MCDKHRLQTCRLAGKRGKRGVTALTRAVSGEKQIYSGNLEILPGIGKPGKFFGKYEIFSGQWAKIWYYMSLNKLYIQWYAPSVCAVFYVFWHLKTAELPMIWKDQSATFPTKIAWSSSAVDHVQSPEDWHKNRTGAYYQFTPIPSFISSGVFLRCTLTSFKSTFHWCILENVKEVRKKYVRRKRNSFNLVKHKWGHKK